MKHCISVLALLFAAAGLSQTITPITSFQPSTYLGVGSWISDDGTTGSYSSYTTVSSYGWETVQNRDGQLYYFESALTVDDNGFFAAEVTDNSDPNNPITYEGFGSCGSIQCQLIVPLNNGILRQGMVIDTTDNSVYIFGSFDFNDGTPNVQWEGIGLPVFATDSESDSDEEDSDFDDEDSDFGDDDSYADSITPMLGFNPGHYIGSGASLADDGTALSFQGFLDLEYSSWTSVVFGLGNLKVAESSLFFDDYGFFFITITDASDPTNPVSYDGSGNCGSSQCQITIPLDNGIVQSNIVFSQDQSSIYAFGGAYFNDGTPNVQWEDSGILLP